MAFIFNNVNLTSLSVVLNESIEIPSTQLQLEKIVVNGRDDVLYRKNRYEERSISIECTLLDKSKKQQVINLLQGMGNLTLLDDLNYYYKAVVVNSIPFKELFRNGVYTFTVEFELQPFKYKKDGNTPIIIKPTPITEEEIDYTGTPYKHTFVDSGAIPISHFNKSTHNINNTSGCEWLPIMELDVIGECLIDFTNGSETQSIHLSNYTGKLVIDSVRMLIHNGAVSKGDLMTGNFPVIRKGLTTISFTSSITQMKLQTNEREL